MKNSFVVPALILLAATLIGGLTYYTYSKNNQLPKILSPQKDSVLPTDGILRIEWTPGAQVTNIQLVKEGSSVFKDFGNIEVDQTLYDIDLRSVSENIKGGLSTGWGYSVKLFVGDNVIESDKFTLQPSVEDEKIESRDRDRKQAVGMLRMALELYYDTHGNSYPDSLSKLSPQNIKEVPLDPLDSTPFEYELSENGYVLKVNFEKALDSFFGAKICNGKVGRYCLSFSN